MAGAIRDGILKTSVFLIAVLMIMSLPNLSVNDNGAEILSNEDFETNGRDSHTDPMDALAEECDGLTFEDMFAYTHARFDVEIHSDWKSADIRAIAWIDGVDAEVVRTDIDELMALLPGNDASENPTSQGGDGYVSTDERAALEQIGPDCVSITDTRFGAYHPHHRGGENWNNMSWTDDTVTLSDENYTCVENIESSGGTWVNGDCVQTLIHQDDPLIDDCAPEKQQQEGCKWVPRSSQYDWVVWLDGELNFNEIEPENLTLAIAGTNVTSADLVITYPANSQNLRVSGSYVDLDCAVSYTETDEESDDNGVTYTPSNCISTQLEDNIEYSMQSVNGGTQLQFHTLLTYEKEHWPANKEYFIDFTTAPPEVDDPPIWTAGVPDDGMILPIKTYNEYQVIVGSDILNSWASDDNGAATFNCTSDIISDLTTDAWGNLVGTPTQSGTVSCGLVDAGGQISTTTKSWNVRTIISLEITGSTSSINTQEIWIGSVGEELGDIAIELVGIQESASTGISECTITVTSVETTMCVLQLSGLSPGDYTLEVTAQGNNIVTWTSEWDLQLSKQSQPPVLIVSGGEWDDSNADGIVDSYTLTGSFNDPDGESVTFTITLDGQTAGSITAIGTTWSSAPIPFDLYPEGEHNITITACDESGTCSTESRTVENLYFTISDVVETVVEVPVDSESSGLPSVGLVGTVVSMISALFVSLIRKRE